MFSSTHLLLPLLLASYVSAHGFVNQFTVNGKTYTSARPSGQRSDGASAIRQITTPDPTYGADNPATNCGPGAFVASEVANVNPGDTLEFDWRGADLSKWPHNMGPVITYLADCGDTPCSEFDSTEARWFKIEQQGRKPGQDNVWFQEDLFDEKTVSVKIPENIAPGNYLMRHEIIALHIAQTARMAEFYASCAQLVIGGSGTGRPAPNELVSFPGGYSDDDPGIRVNVFNGQQYTFPGPPIARLVSGGGGSSDDSPGASSTSTSSGSKPTQTSTGGGSNTGGSGSGSNNGGSGTSSGSGSSSSGGPKKVCKLKKGAKSKGGAGSAGEVYPRHFTRVMRRLASHIQRVTA